MKIKIKKYYMITLSTSKRFKKYYENSDTIKSKIIKYPAIDSRPDFILTCEEKGYKINLNPLYKEHFNRCKGAFGCTLSHASIYEMIIGRPKYEYYCVLEDDVKPNLLEDFIKVEEHIIPDNVLIINLIGGIDSTAAYLINSLGAQILLRDLNKEVTLPHDKFMFEYCKNRHPHIFHQMKLLEQYIPKNLLDPNERDLI